MNEPGMVIIGAGEAGTRVALTLRDLGWDGAVTLVGEEVHLPYERPPLSKAVMLSAETPGATTLVAEETLRDRRIEHLSGRRVERIERDGHRVLLDDGNAVPYARLLIATGARARRLAVPGATHDTVLYLRNFTEALALRGHLRAGSRLLVVGGGFIGLEMAASAVVRGCSVTLVEAAPALLSRGVPAGIAKRVEARHRAAGVDIRLGLGVERIVPEGDGTRTVTLADGSTVACDAIVAGVGAIPETTLAHDAGLEIANGIRVDETLRTGDPDIFAAGDCCCFPHRLYGGRMLRLEAWRNARDQGALVARTMLGGSDAYDTVPWFWSDQYDQTLQIAGLPDEGTATVVREIAGDGYLCFHLADDGRLVAASGVGPMSIGKEVRLAEMLIQRQARPDPAALASPEVRLKSLLRG